MKIEHEGIIIELTQDQIDNIDRQKNRYPSKKWVTIEEAEQIFKERIVDKIDIHHPKVSFGWRPTSLFWFDDGGKFICSYNWDTGAFYVNFDALFYVDRNIFSYNSKLLEVFVKKYFPFAKDLDYVWLTNGSSSMRHFKTEYYKKNPNIGLMNILN